MRTDSEEIKNILQFEEAHPHRLQFSETDDRLWEIRWFLGHDIHREFGPAIEKFDGSQEWMFLGVRHREDGPAIIAANGDTCWYLNGLIHRTDGPAMESDRTKSWFIQGKRHRKDGPAVERENGGCEYWLHGKKMDSRRSYLRELKKKIRHRDE